MEHAFPLGIAKQAVMKLDSFITDIREMSQEEGLDSNIVETLDTIGDVASSMAATLVNMVSAEMGEEEFLNEDIAMDEIDAYPAYDHELPPDRHDDGL